MNCDEVRSLLDAYVDGELDLVTSLAIEQHLEGCAGCTQIYQNRLRLRSAFSAEALYFRPSANFEKQLRTTLRKETGSSPTLWNWEIQPRWLGLTAVLIGALVLIGVIALSRGTVLSGVANNLAEEVVSSHIRSLMADHISDVVSSDQHTVKPWFDGKLDYSPSVVDFADQGYPLLGGRLDYLDNRPVAALVYRYEKHIINLFIWPATTQSSSGAPSIETIQGYNVIRWQQANMNYWAVSDVEISKLQTFVGLIQSQVPPKP